MVFWGDQEFCQDPHAVLESRFCPTSGSGISYSFWEFFGVLPSFLLLFHLPWVGVLFFGSISGFPWVGVQVLFLSFGLELGFLRSRATFPSLLCFQSPWGTLEAIAKFSFHQVSPAPVGLGISSIVNSTSERLQSAPTAQGYAGGYCQIFLPPTNFLHGLL